ncbi:hypothetical protein EVAR_102806_1 [Eumeta japonica]|uniref:Uncharacterized protein n=1 Tax=Eumeta variegata TaxID=151549 RepID=A0A4C1THX7_EUMVA|nr:hypothetical protein EVAR_102806_1 [Eumeta japonica]
MGPRFVCRGNPEGDSRPAVDVQRLKRSFQSECPERGPVEGQVLETSHVWDRLRVEFSTQTCYSHCHMGSILTPCPYPPS